MYKLLRRLFPRWYYNREFKRLDPLLRKLAVPFELPYLEMEMWGPPLSREVLGDLYAFIFFGTPHNCPDQFLVEAAEYMRDMAEDDGFDKMNDFTLYYNREKRIIRKKIRELIRSNKPNSKQDL